MSDNFPLEIQELIIERIVPAKSLIRFRSVSKQWKSLIDSSKFITQHHQCHNQTQPDHLLVRFRVFHDFKYVSVVDDDSLPQHKFPLFVPSIVRNLLVNHAYTLDSSHGLLGLYGSYIDDHDRHKTHKNQVVIWNPSIRKTVGIMLPNSLNLHAVGFGVCPKTYDPKVVKITRELKAEVFTLSTGAWRRISLNPALQLGLVWFNKEPVVMNGVIYWIVYNLDNVPNRQIITFDVTNEVFGEVALQVGLSGTDIFIYKPKESIALVCETNNKMDYDVWMMVKDGDSNCKFEKLFTVAYDRLRFYDVYYISGFRMNGQPIIMRHVGKYDVKAGENIHKVYDPSSRNNKELEIDVDAVYEPFFKMVLHKESLLMLNQPATVFWR